jgi:hypothetical protein
MPVYALIVDGVPYSLGAEVAPSIGDVIGLDDESLTVRVVRSANRGRTFIAKPVDRIA